MSLRARVMVRAGLALGLLLVADSVRREQIMDRADKRSLAERAALLVSIQAEALSVPIWNLDRDQLGAALDALMADPDFVATSVVLPDGRVLDQRHANGRQADGPPLIAVSRDILFRSHGELRTLGTLHLVLGTGYSSLSYLRRMPFDKIEIDRSFVSALGQDEAAAALVRSIIALARGLGLETNAEGVETAQQARLLREEGCGEVQGFHFGRPMPADDFLRLQPDIKFAKSA